MIQAQTELNLARKWRPKIFGHIVGQDIPIRMLKNGLFLRKFFPVYLFAGQRGCGKTSTARVFGAAVNCHQLESFQKDPNISLPCLTCESCRAMINGHHPDFIEIDAASHTGVDNVRQIIDASSYMPLLGQKKIYLIDEAHMLSKAAFNAFLKILEEPPVSVLFILATTETQKIPQTVLSRCFQIIFTPIENTQLKNHLETICAKENITFDASALDLLLTETEGSARDAINLLERVRFSCTHITEQTILSVLGKISNQDLYTLFDRALNQQPQQLLEHLHGLSFETLSPQILWDMLINLCRTIVWIKYQATATLPPWIKNNEQLQQITQRCSLARLHAIMNLFWTQEELFFKTNKKHAFLEMVLLQMCAQVNLVDLEPLIKACTTGQQLPQPPIKAIANQISSQEIQPKVVNAVPLAQITPVANEISNNTLQPWNLFLQKVTEQADALLCSIFAQAKAIGPSSDHTLFTVELNSGSKFFKDKLEECKKDWLPLFIAFFPNCKDIAFQDPTGQPTPPTQPLYQSVARQEQGINREHKPTPTPQPTSGHFPYKKSNFTSQKPLQREQLGKNLNLEPINIDDKDKWPLANLIISHFPGKIRRLKE